MHLNAPLGDYSSILNISLGKMKIKIATCFEIVIFFVCMLESIDSQTDIENISFL